jgi:Flp pilus assembly pilin Flp
MGETRAAHRLSNAAGRRAPGRLAARPGLRRQAGDRRGATVEYALLAGFLGMGIVTTLSTLDTQLYDLVNMVMDAVGRA